jgi:hypothetical protein
MEIIMSSASPGATAGGGYIGYDDVDPGIDQRSKPGGDRFLQVGAGIVFDSQPA